MHFRQNKNQNSLQVKSQNDKTSPGLGRGRVVPSSHKGSEFRYIVDSSAEEIENQGGHSSPL